MPPIRAHVIAVVLAAALSIPVIAQETGAPSGNKSTADELAKQLQNPIAALISFPLESNPDWGAGADGDGFQYKLNIQPVIPITLNKTWNLISRTIVPVVYQDKVTGPNDSQSGVGDVLQSLFFSPQAPTAKGWIWGVGPLFLLPTATDDVLGTDKWSTGPTIVALKQENGWTYGALTYHLWSFAGDDDRSNVNLGYFQPFLAFTTPKQRTYSAKLESSYDWENSELTAPVNLAVAQLVMIGKQPVQFELGGRYYFDAPPNGPEYGVRFKITLLFPK